MITIQEIQIATANYFATRLADMTSHRRARSIARPRQIAMYLSKELTDRSYPVIGRAFGGRDHTTVMYACRHVEDLMERYPRQIGEPVEYLRRFLLNADELAA